VSLSRRPDEIKRERERAREIERGGGQVVIEHDGVSERERKREEMVTSSGIIMTM
jgi:hypothetical protein